MATILVGNQNLEIDAKQLDSYLKGGTMPPALATALAPMVSAPSSPTGGTKLAGSKVVIYNGPFAADRAGAGLARLGLSQPDGTELAKSLDRTYGDRISLFTSSDLRAGAERFNGSMGSLLRNGSTLFADAAVAR
jgi:hypothetical protein